MKRNQKAFSWSLYREGLLHIKLVGVAAAVVCIVLCTLVVGVRFSEPSIIRESGIVTEDGATTFVETVTPQNVAVPAILLLCFAPFFAMSQFRYLDDRAKSDFFHSIPYTRTCTFISFFAAIITWIVGIAIASYGISMLLWTLHPNYAFLVGPALFHMLKLILGCVLLSAIMSVAMSLTGTAASNLALFALMCCVVRMVCGLFLSTMEELVPIVQFGDVTSFLSPVFFLPFGLLYELLSGEALITAPVIWYNLAVTAVMLAVGMLLYCLRRSETAGSSAPSRAWQHVYRCAFCLPFAMAVATVCFQSSTTTVAVMLVFTLLIYFLYELITTKKLKNLLSAAPFLGVLLLGGLLFSGTVIAAREITLNNAPSADQIESVSLPDMETGTTYERLCTQSANTDDPEAIALVADSLKRAVTAIRNGDYNAYRFHLDKKTSMRNITVNVVICKKDGSRITRVLSMQPNDHQKIIHCLSNSDSFRNAVIAMPSQSQITQVSATYQTFSSQEAQKSIWELYLSEYNALSDEEKLQLKGYGTTTEDQSVPFLIVTGLHEQKRFTSSYPLDERFPKTVRQINEALQKSGESSLTTVKRLLQSFVDTDFDNLDPNLNSLYCELLLRKSRTDNGIFYYCMWDSTDGSSAQDETSHEEMQRCCKLLLEHWNEITDVEQSPGSLVSLSFVLSKSETEAYRSEDCAVFVRIDDALYAELGRSSTIKDGVAY